MTTPAHPLLEPIQAIHRDIRRRVVVACERAAAGALSDVARDVEGDTIYAIDTIAEHALADEIERTIATREAPVVLVAEGLDGGEIVIPADARDGCSSSTRSTERAA
jgi:hypothetical protein